jgi:NitT/TauT family transport system ATP-binding protein
MTVATDTRPAIVLPTVRLNAVGKTFGSTIALTDVDLTVTPGEFVCLLGASGCGKTTLLNLIAGFDTPTEGTVQVRGGRPAVVFQEPALLPWLTAAGNIELPLRLRRTPKVHREARVRELLELVRLGSVGAKRPHQLSGGMRQRVALARALASADTGVLLMDEPFAALDAITRDVLQDELIRLWRRTGVAIVFVTHDVREAARLGERVVLLSSRPGTVVQEWSVADATGQEELVDEIGAALREVISRHGR